MPTAGTVSINQDDAPVPKTRTGGAKSAFFAPSGTENRTGGAVNSIFLYICVMESQKHIIILVAAACIVTACGYRGALHASYIPEVTDSTHYEGVRPEYQQLAALMEKDTGLPTSTGNTLAYIPNGAQKLELMLYDMNRAQESLYLEYYRICVDSAGVIVLNLLKDKASAGLDVRAYADKAAVIPEYRKKFNTLNDVGGLYRSFYKPVWVMDHLVPPAGTHREHRKILMVDGQTAYLGGRNIQDKYWVSWRDADVRITGPAIEHIATVYMENLLRIEPSQEHIKMEPDLEAAALRDTIPGLKQFYGKTVQIVHDSPTDKILPIRNCFEWAINNSKCYFWLYCPYTPPPKSTLKALKDAATRGVDVRWIIPGISDVFFEKHMAESLYKDLLEAGVRIFEWQPTILHAKQFMTDDYLTAIGSANMDNLSFFLNYEVETLIYDEEFTLNAKELYLEDIREHCHEVSLDEVKRWNIFRRFRNWFVYTFGGPVG